MGSMRRLVGIALGLALLLAMTAIGVVLADGPQLGGKLITGSDITIAAGETVDHDLYVFGGRVVSNGTINGDIVAAAGNVDVNGPVTGDVLVAGGQVSVNGTVGGDVRVAGGQVTVNGDVKGDVLAAGGQVTMDGSVGEDLIVGTGQLTLSGSVAGSTAGSAGAYTKTGTVSGTDSIVITGNEPRAPVVTSNPVLDAIRQFLAVMLLAIVVTWLAPRLLPAAETEVRTQPLASLAWGVLACLAYIVAVILIGIVAIVLAVGLGALTFGGLAGLDLFAGFVAISTLTLAFIVAVGFLVDAVVGLAIGRLIAGSLDRTSAGGTAFATSPSRWPDLAILAIGVAIVVVLSSLPVVGGWIKLLIVFVGLGALWLTVRSGGWWPRRAVTTEATVTPPAVASTTAATTTAAPPVAVPPAAAATATTTPATTTPATARRSTTRSRKATSPPPSGPTEQ
jgi:hypothetical protein